MISCASLWYKKADMETTLEKRHGVKDVVVSEVGVLSVVAMFYAICCAGAFGIEEMIPAGHMRTVDPGQRDGLLYGRYAVDPHRAGFICAGQVEIQGLVYR